MHIDAMTFVYMRYFLCHPRFLTCGDHAAWHHAVVPVNLGTMVYLKEQHCEVLRIIVEGMYVYPFNLYQVFPSSGTEIGV